MNSHIDYADALLGKARDDAYVVRCMSADASAPDWIIGFHAQQAVEKAIKSALTRHEVEFPRTHNLSMLIELLRRHGIAAPPDADDLARLTPFGVALRYDDSAGEDDPTLERAWAMDVVQRTLDWATA
ncbi:MAG: HEPN domain-containing protein [Sulfuritalea sp.]|nr:HEPN domain-containing protein [Sulfuritalea sp.]MDP1982705.1 HEPN domain-containing protein [Sulfuritalea sp.]